VCGSAVGGWHVGTGGGDTNVRCAHQLMDNMFASASQSLRLPLDAHAAASAALLEPLAGTSLLAPVLALPDSDGRFRPCNHKPSVSCRASTKQARWRVTFGLTGVSSWAACTVEAVESLATWFSSSLSSPPSLLRASCRRSVLLKTFKKSWRGGGEGGGGTCSSGS
jgi:hypothetical protein